MPGHDIIVVGASAGGVEALIELAHALPKDLPAAIFLAMHVPPNAPSVMPNLLNRAGVLKAVHPTDREQIVPGRIYVAPPNFHMLIKRGHVRLIAGPRENGHRPAIDPLFRTAALAYGPRVVAVVLSGNLDDGTAGVQAVKARGGVAVVQDPEEALYEGMPMSAIENADVDHILPLSDIAPTLARLAHEPVSEGAHHVSDDMKQEVDAVELEPDATGVENTMRLGRPAGLTCPECHGALWEVQDTDLLRFRCHVGHAFTADSLLAEQGKDLEAALWMALRALEENAMLTRRLAHRAHKHGNGRSATRFEEQARGIEARAEVIRRVLRDGLPAAMPESARVNPSAIGPTPSDVGLEAAG